MAEVLPSGTVTLLLGDLEGSVSLWEQDATTMKQAMGRVDDLVADQVEEHHGECPVEQGEGDSFVLAFRRASDAIACALGLQRAFVKEEWPGGLNLRFRMAVHTGEVQLRDEQRYVGPAINRCARLRNLGWGGQTLLSQVTEGLVVDHLPNGAVLRDLGEHELRGMARPEQVFQLTHPDLDDDFPPLTVSGQVDCNLPTQVTSFVGRAGDLAEVGRLLGQAHLLTLLGAGGIGKTRLALEAAAAIKDRYDHGAQWVDLAPLTDADLVAPTVATAVGANPQPGESVVDALRRALSDRRLLLLLDNCEHLVDAAASLVAAVVRACPGVDVLATSREPLGVEGEASLRVTPLEVPPDTDGGPEYIADFGAVQLFVDRARGVQPGFRLAGRNASAAAEICRRLDGIPLAIELAAARVRLLSPSQVAAGLSDRFRLLTGGPRTAMARQRTLEASVAWSHDLLSTNEQLVLARLSVFAGTFDLDAAEAVCTDDAIDADAVLDLLSGLVDRSLVQVIQATSQARYRLLETIRVFARQQLATMDDLERVRDRHLSYYRQLSARAQAGLFTDLDEWLGRLTQQLDDLRAAMDWAMASGQAIAVVEIAERTYALWMVRGLYAETHRRLEAAVNADDVTPLDRARGNYTASVLAMMGGDYLAGYEFAARAVALAEDLDAPTVQASSHLYRAFTGYLSGRADDDQLRSDFERAHEAAALMDHAILRTLALVMQGFVEANQRSITDGIVLLEQGLSAARDAELVQLQVIALAWLVGVESYAGRMGQARQHGREALDLAGDLGFDAFASIALALLSANHTFMGEEEPARQLGAESRQMARRAGLSMFELYGLRMQAIADLWFADPVHARDTANEFLAAVGRPSMEGVEQTFAYWLSGTAALRAGDLARARAHLEAGRDRASRPSLPFVLGRCLLGLSHVAEAEDDIDAAWELAHEALEVLATWGDSMGSADALEAIAGLSVATGAPDKGARLLGTAHGQRRATATTRMALEAERYDTILAATHHALDDVEFARWFDEGAGLGLADAVAYVQRGRGERGRPAVGWQSLTPTELDVVRLVAEGLRNADIAERLFVSVNTVKTHLSHTYTKLGLTTRAELAAEAARRDL